MPPKAEPVTETPAKGRGAIVKRPPTKTSPAKPGPRSSETVANRDLLFLWRAVKLSGGITPDKEALGRELGCSAGAAIKRWHRLKAKMEGIEAAQGADNDANNDDADMGGDPNDAEDEMEDEKE
ncbi:hypothetical protein N7541_002224 [Penicillium brevicompactum]|uniref:Myb-like DNA-binding domain-containing protein n=1 Tax=Penicillium brevicompactum TaxID=5074 RepID=A0A9W9RKT5_PENBR|nr:hypothetical protein N7541_002224 [Penicillium brevicompactum]